MDNKRFSDQSTDKSFAEKVIRVDRINKVVSGGKRLAFRAFVIVGDGESRVGLGVAKAKEVAAAIKKAVDRARKSMVTINMVNDTIPHEVESSFGAAYVLLKPARPGTGVIAGGAVRILLESAGLKNVVAKSLRSRNPINSSRAAMSALLSLKNYDQQVALRGKALPVYQKRTIQPVIHSVGEVANG